MKMLCYLIFTVYASHPCICVSGSANRPPAATQPVSPLSLCISILVPGDVMLRLAWLLLWAMVCLPSYGWVEGWRHTQCLYPLLFLYIYVMVQEERWLLQPRALLLPAAQLHDVRLHREVHKAQGL